MTVPTGGLFVAPCSREAATFAVKAWHYSHSMPAGLILPFGAWWDSAFDGTVVISRGASANIGRPFSLSQDRIAEVTRIALRPGHRAPAGVEAPAPTPAARPPPRESDRDRIG